MQNALKQSLDSISDLLIKKPSNSPSLGAKSSFNNNMFPPKRNKREESIGISSNFDIVIEEEEEHCNRNSKIFSKDSNASSNKNTNQSANTNKTNSKKAVVNPFNSANSTKLRTGLYTSSLKESNTSNGNVVADNLNVQGGNLNKLSAPVTPKTEAKKSKPSNKLTSSYNSKLLLFDVIVALLLTFVA